MRLYKTYQKVLICIFPFLAIAVLYFAVQFTLRYIPLPGCMTYTLLGIYCPGCGCTRAVAALANGDILLSLRQNLIILLSIIVVALYYIEFVLRAFGKNFRFPFLHNIKVLYAVLIFMTVYCVLRNFIPVLAPI